MRVLNHGNTTVIFVTEEMRLFAGNVFVQMIRRGTDVTVVDMTYYNEDDLEELRGILNRHQRYVLYGVQDETPWVEEVRKAKGQLIVAGEDDPVADMISGETKKIWFAGGCFWGMEKVLKIVPGVLATTVGYANGHTENPTYKEVCTDTTGFRETVQTEYDPEKVSLAQLLDVYFLCIDPTVQNQQGHDIGSQYQTGVYYEDENDRKVIEEVFARKRQEYQVFVVELEKLRNFYDAEEYHQDYLDKNPDGYCHITGSEMRAVQKYLKDSGLV